MLKDFNVGNLHKIMEGDEITIDNTFRGFHENPQQVN